MAGLGIVALALAMGLSACSKERRAEPDFSAPDVPGADLVVALTVNGTVRATVTVAAGAHRGVVSVTPLSLAIGDVLDFNVTQVGSTLPGANLTVTAITREFGV